MTILAHPTVTKDAIAMASLQRRFGLFAVIDGKRTKLIQRQRPRTPVDLGPFGGDAA